MEEIDVKARDANNQVAKLIVKAIDDDLRIAILRLIIREGPLSFRAISRKLGTNYKRLEKAINNLKKAGLLTYIEARPSKDKCFKLYYIPDHILQPIKIALSEED
ncbi:MAG: winged helix-turn-helix domain-containing protein [Fervidicoccaceae archaeon]